MSLSYGTQQVFESSNQNNFPSSLPLGVVNLDASNFLVARRNSSTVGVVSIATISGNAISYGTEYAFTVDPTSNISIDVLDSTHFVVSYYVQVAGNTRGRAIIGSISGGVISYGAENTYQINFLGGSCTTVKTLDSTHFALGFTNNGSLLPESIVGSVSGVTITFGTIVPIGSSGIQNGILHSIQFTKIDSTHIIAVFEENSVGKQGYCFIGTISGTSITWGSPTFFGFQTPANNAGYTSVCTLDSTHFVLVYTAPNGGNGKAAIGVISGSTVTFGTEVQFNATTVDIWNCVATLDSTHFVVGYVVTPTNQSDGTGNAIIGTVTGGNVITFGTGVQFSSVVQNLQISALNSTTFMAIYTDSNNNHAGTGIIGIDVTSTPGGAFLLKMLGN